MKHPALSNLPPGVHEHDPHAPWNEPDWVEPDTETIMDELFQALRFLDLDPDYKSMTKIRFIGGELEVKFND